MRPQLLLRLYPRAWRERYGEELSALLEAQRPLSLGALADLLRGALAAHFHPLARHPDAMRSSKVSNRPAIASRFVVVWTPLAAVGIGAAMVLIDFWFGHGHYRMVGFSPGLSRADQLALPRVRYFQYEELYDLALHLAMLAIALAAALIFASLARRVISPSRQFGEASGRKASQ
jgi:hypothetical protein